MLLIVAAMSVFYVRRMVKMGEAPMTSATEAVAQPRPEVAPRAATIRRQRRRRLRRAAWNVVGLAVFVVLVFPVFWMISTAFKPDTEINSLLADVVLGASDAASTSATRSRGHTSGRSSRTA